MSTWLRFAHGRRLAAALTAVTLLACATATAARSHYVELQADDFVIVSAAGEERTRAIAAKLTMFRAAMESVFGLRVNRATPTRIYALSARDWARYAQPRAEVAGYFVPHPFASDLLFDVEAEDPRGYELMLHEYTHHVLRTLSSGRYPAFFDEGLAEVFSTASLQRDTVRFAPRPEYVAFLRRREWLPFERLLEIGRRDPEYVDHTLSPAFYAQAWATMYYAVAVNSSFGNRLLDYVRDLNSGVPPDTAAHGLLGGAPAHVNGEIARFILNRRFLPAAQIQVGGVTSDAWLAVRNVTDTERTLLLGELLIRLGGRSAEALDLLRTVREPETDAVRAKAGEVLAHLQRGERDAALSVLDGLDAPHDLAPAAALSLGGALFEVSRQGVAGLRELDPTERDRVSRARALFQQALHDERCWVEATHGYVLTSLALEDHDAAVVELASRAYAAAPKNAELAVSLAILHELDGRKSIARRYWTEAARNLHEGPTRTRILRQLALEEIPAQR